MVVTDLSIKSSKYKPKANVFCPMLGVGNTKI